MFKFNFFKTPETPEKTEVPAQETGKTPETITMNSSAAESGDLEKEARTEFERKSNIEVYYNSPEYKEAEALFEENPELFLQQLTEALSVEMSRSNDNVGEDEDVVGVDKENDSVDGVDGVEGVENEDNIIPLNFGDTPIKRTLSAKPSFFRTIILPMGAALGAALLVACDRQIKNEFSASPSVGVVKNEDGTYGIKFRIDIKTDNTTEKHFNENAIEIGSNTNTTTSGKGSPKEGSPINKNGPENRLKDFLGAFKNVGPGGLPTKDSVLVLNEVANNAIGFGIVPYNPDHNVFALEIMKDQARQGIPVDALVYYRMTHGQLPRFVCGSKTDVVKAIGKYIPNDTRDFSQFDYNQFEKDLENSIDKNHPDLQTKGKFDPVKFRKMLTALRDCNYAILKAVMEWSKQDIGGRQNLYKQHSIPVINR